MFTFAKLKASKAMDPLNRLFGPSSKHQYAVILSMQRELVGQTAETFIFAEFLLASPKLGLKCQVCSGEGWGRKGNGTDGV